MSVQDFLNVALHEVGYEEGGGSSGHNGNITKEWAELQPDFQGQPWCAAYVCWVAKHAGHPIPQIDHPWGFSYCPDAVSWAKSHGLWDASGHYAPGDIIFFNFKGGTEAQHVGIVVSDDGHTVHTVEGNTEPTNNGDQANGGGVYRKDRVHGSEILGVMKWSKVLSGDHNPAPKPAPHPAPAPGTHNPPPHGYPEPVRVLQKGSKGDDVKWVQDRLVRNGSSVHVDGDFGDATANAVVSFQARHNLHQDGVVGSVTISVLRQVK